MVRKKLLKTYFKTSIPAAMDMVAQTITWSIEAILLGHLSAHALAGVGIALQVIILTFAVVLTFIVGSSIIILRHLGQKDYFSANHILAQALLMGVILSVIIGIMWYYGATKLFLFIGGESSQARIYGTEYLKTIALAAPIMITNFIALGIIRSSGDTFHSLVLNLTANAINLLLAPFLIFGLWIFPRMEVAGAAISIITAHSIVILLTLKLLRSRRIDLYFSFKEFISPRWVTLKQILKLGFPTTVEQLIWAAGQLILSIYVAKLGVVYLAVHQILVRIQSIITMVYHGFGSGAMTMIGKFLGAEQIKMFKKTAWLSTAIGLGVATVCGLLLYFGGAGLLRLFTTDKEVFALGMTVIPAMALVQLSKGSNLVFSQSLRGGADIKWLMWVTVASVLVFEVSGAYITVFIFNLGLASIWLIQGIDELSRLIANLLRFFKKDWTANSVKI